jgi:hypothetical protein
MTIYDELQNFDRILAQFCKVNAFKYSCLISEQDFDGIQRMALAPYLHLAHVVEEQVCGHIIPTAEGRNLFIRVRTPLAASTTLKFVALRTYSLILSGWRGMKANRYARNLSPEAAQTDLENLLSEATAAVLQFKSDELDFIQADQLAPMPTKSAELLAWRSTVFTGTVTGTVAPAASPTATAADVTNADIYLL